MREQKGFFSVMDFTSEEQVCRQIQTLTQLWNHASVGTTLREREVRYRLREEIYDLYDLLSPLPVDGSGTLKTTREIYGFLASTD